MATFQSEQDVHNEEEVIQTLLNHINQEQEVGLQYIKLPKWELDFMVVDEEKIKAFVEVKCYTKSFEQSDTQMISLIKYKKMLTYNKLSATYFVAKYSCGTIAYIPVTKISGKVGWGGRAYRGGANDLEKLIFCPKEKFKIIK